MFDTKVAVAVVAGGVRGACREGTVTPTVVRALQSRNFQCVQCCVWRYIMFLSSEQILGEPPKF